MSVQRLPQGASFGGLIWFSFPLHNADIYREQKLHKTKFSAFKYYFLWEREQKEPGSERAQMREEWGRMGGGNRFNRRSIQCKSYLKVSLPLRIEAIIRGFFKLETLIRWMRIAWIALIKFYFLCDSFNKQLLFWF